MSVSSYEMLLHVFEHGRITTEHISFHNLDIQCKRGVDDAIQVQPLRPQASGWENMAVSGIIGLTFSKIIEKIINNKPDGLERQTDYRIT